MVFGVPLSPDATTRSGALGAPQVQALPLLAFNCLQEAQSQLQRDTSSAEAPAWPIKSLKRKGGKSKNSHEGEACSKGKEPGSLCALLGRCTEKPKPVKERVGLALTGVDSRCVCVNLL